MMGIRVCSRKERVLTMLLALAIAMLGILSYLDTVA